MFFLRNISSRCIITFRRKFCQKHILDEYADILSTDSEYDEIAGSNIRLNETHNCFIIQPYVKWGPKKLSIKPQEQLDEARALIKSLPAWQVEDSITVPLENLEKNTLFKSGSMEKLTTLIRKNNNISAVFVNTGNLKRIQTSMLNENFHLPIFDRYEIVMKILKNHAISKHAKLQVALAELYYLQRKAQKGLLFTSTDSDTVKLMFKNREQKLINALKEVRNQRTLLRHKRQKLDYPIVAVVGYTNAGKTSVIKALTGEESLMPKNQLFATLDVTNHSGILPSGLEILYVDTVGFISDIPTNLIECFVATLEDAILADVILHVEDISDSCYEYKKEHVLNTLKDLGNKSNVSNILEKIVTVKNKCDLVKNSIDEDGDSIYISAKTDHGLNDLRFTLEKTILKVTERQKITIKVPNGGDEIRWLYKNSTVVSVAPDSKNGQLIKASVIILKNKLQHFKNMFI